MREETPSLHAIWMSIYPLSASDEGDENNGHSINTVKLSKDSNSILVLIVFKISMYGLYYQQGNSWKS